MLSQILLPLLIALSPNDRVEMELTGGDTVTGSLSSAQPGVLFIHSAQGHLEVNLELVRSARINDVEISINALHQESEDLWQATSERLTPLGSLPNPYWAATASALLPGTGQRMLGQDRSANSYLVADLVLLSLSSWLIFGRQDYGNALPLLGLDTLFRIYSSAEAYKDTRVRSALISGERHIGR
jgi:hypothetical protein